MKFTKKTTEWFIEESVKIHGDRYDYSLCKYTGALEKVKIICREHGEFEQIAFSHKSGKNCPKCNKRRQLSKAEYIEKLNKIHNNKYEYFIEDEFHSHKKIRVACKNHGEFEIRLSSHIQGSGCIKCHNDSMKKTNEEFLKKCKEVHGDRYDYSETIYELDSEKVKIICKIHGPFHQIANSHINGSGCAKCSGKHKYTNQEILQKFKDKHGKRFIYPIFEDHISVTTRISIICKQHGVFNQTIQNHFKHSGCKKCSYPGSTKEVFIESSLKIHGDKYDYSEVDYIRNHIPVKIICTDHGSYWQRPAVHLQGSGCKKCNSSKGENFIRNFLKERNILFEEQKTFEECKNKQLLRFDFYLIEHNTLLEFNGQQHYSPVRRSKKQTEEEVIKEHNYIKNNDLIKEQFCKKNDIVLHYIKWRSRGNYTKDLEDILKTLESETNG